MRIMVTGGTGVLGREVVSRLRDAGEAVLVASRRPGLGRVVADLSTGAGLAEAVAGTDVVVHLATTYTGRGDLSAARQLLATGPQRLVCVSIVGIDRVPYGYYRGKLAVERLIERSGVPYTILRTTQFHDLVRTMFAGAAKLPVMPVPDVRVQPVDVRDVAERLVALTLADPAGRVPDLGGPQVHEVRDLARGYLLATGQRRPVVPVRLPLKAFRAYRAGGNLTESHPTGKITFAEYLAEHPDPRRVSYRGPS